MKAHITLTDQNGTVFEGEAELVQVGRSQNTKRASSSPKRTTSVDPVPQLDFTKPERAFIKTYARRLNGQKKFVLLLAYLAKGALKKEVQLKKLEKHWNRMKASNLLGLKFNTFYSNTAKDDGWVDTPKKGVYVLCKSWKEVLEGNNG